MLAPNLDESSIWGFTSMMTVCSVDLFVSLLLSSFPSSAPGSKKKNLWIAFAIKQTIVPGICQRVDEDLTTWICNNSKMEIQSVTS